MSLNKHQPTVDGFGDEWERFDQSKLSKDEHNLLFNRYFRIFPWDELSATAVGFDMGCGSGRWAKLVAPKIGVLHCIDPSSALAVARRTLTENSNCVFHAAGVSDQPLPVKSMDFGYSLGVLHHVPDTAAGIAACVSMLKPGAPFLLYLYYRFDTRPMWFRMLWRVSDLVRRAVSLMPNNLRYVMSQMIAALVYWPLARSAKLAENLGVNVENFPLAPYRNCGFYVMRTDALDRFGTRLEQRFTKLEIKKMMEAAGLWRIRFSEEDPFWCAVGYKKANS